MTFSLNSPDGGTTWVLTFTDSSYIGGSLPDGGYILTVTAADVTNAYSETLSGGNQNFSFSRLYGDFTGQGVVNAQDFTLLTGSFGLVLSSSQWYLDYYDQGIDSGADFVQLASRFGLIAVAPPSPDVAEPASAAVIQPASVSVTPIEPISAPAAPPIVSTSITPPITPVHKPAPKPAAVILDTGANTPDSPLGPDFTNRFFNRQSDQRRSVLE
jgi:hypothetical protein